MEALPYIRRFYHQTMVIKYGGHAMEDENPEDRLCQGHRSDEIHRFESGGGPWRRPSDQSRCWTRCTSTSRFVQGVRVTDEPDHGRG